MELHHQFRRDLDPQFFASAPPGPRAQPKKSAARELIEQLRKQNHSVYEISEALKERGVQLSPTAVRVSHNLWGWPVCPWHGPKRPTGRSAAGPAWRLELHDPPHLVTGRFKTGQGWALQSRPPAEPYRSHSVVQAS